MKIYKLNKMEDNKEEFEETTEGIDLILDDISEKYNIDRIELEKSKYLMKEEKKEEIKIEIKEEVEKEVKIEPIVQYISEIKDGKLIYKDKYSNIYDENFKYIEKEDNRRKKKEKKKKN